MIYVNFSSSSLINTTFTNITSLYGSVYINNHYYSPFTISFCIFTQCIAFYGGALYLSSSTPYIYISHTRFENNSVDDYGYYIYVGSYCFNRLDSSVCSTTPLGRRVNCSTSQLLNNCSEKVV
jgi:hypothetical protein